MFFANTLSLTQILRFAASVQHLAKEHQSKQTAVLHQNEEILYIFPFLSHCKQLWHVSQLASEVLTEYKECIIVINEVYNMHVTDYLICGPCMNSKLGHSLTIQDCFRKKEPTHVFSRCQLFCYSRSLKCPLHIVLRIRVSIMEL